MYGHKIIQQTVVDNEIVNVQQLPKGMYLYRIFDSDKFVKSGKLIVK